MWGLLPWWGRVLAVAAVIAAAVFAWNAVTAHYEDIGDARGANRVQHSWDVQRHAQDEADLAAAQEHAVESKRRISKQEENQELQNHELAQLRVDRDRAVTVAARVQRDSQSASEQWRARLADAPSVADIAAAGTTIVLLTDMLGKSRERSRVLADFADTSRTSGLKCERDYDALTKR